MYQLYVKLVFVNGSLDEEAYVSFMIKGQEDRVYRLRKALYGLNQAARAWKKMIEFS